MKKNKRNPFLVKAGFITMLIGIMGLIFPFISFRNSDDFKLLDAKAKESASSQFIYSSNGMSVSTPNPNLPNINNRLSIPQIGVDMPIFTGDSANLLLKGGWMFPGTSEPQFGGNTVIFGHRFRYLPPISNTFFALDKLKIGETFKLAWQDKTYLYIVREKKIIEPTDFSVIAKSAIPRITLITCAPLFSTKQRLVIIADLLQ